MYKQQIKSGALGSYDLDYQYAKCRKKKKLSRDREKRKRELSKFEVITQDRSHIKTFNHRLTENTKNKQT